MVKIFFYGFILLYSVMGYSMTQDKTESLPESIKSGRFDSLDIICIPSTVESFIPINQENLDSGYFYKVSVQKIKATPFWPDLIEALNKTEIKPIDDLKDLRCAIIFYNEKVKSPQSIMTKTESMVR